MKKCRPVVKGPSGGTLLFCFALPARGASCPGDIREIDRAALPRRCLHGVHRPLYSAAIQGSASLPRRCLHGVHHSIGGAQHGNSMLCLGAACTGCILSWCSSVIVSAVFASALPARGASCWAVPTMLRPCMSLPRRCLHGVHRRCILVYQRILSLCLGAACTGCILQGPAGAPGKDALPRRCLHGVHRQKPTNCGTPFCSIRRESVDSFSEINNKDSCADYFPALFCCQGDLHHHYRQPRTDNRPVLRCEQHRLFLFILSSHYRRLL